MLQQLISHSEDISKLSEEGYEMEVEGAYLIVNHIPYVNMRKEVSYGSLVAALTIAGPGRTGVPPDHTIYFRGDKPCDSLGQPLDSIINSSGNQQLTTNLVINHFFSSKPKSGNYPDYYEKIRTYAGILASQAQVIDPNVTAKPGRIRAASNNESVFQYPDTNSARARIDFLNVRFENHRIAIIGLGGTGSYILDLVAKTPVKEIHLFDGDIFQVHNAFRAPGAPTSEKFNETDRLFKTDYYYSIYSNMHRGIQSHPNFINEENASSLSEVDLVFVCVDKNEIRHFVINYLLSIGKPFIDVGIGVHIVDDSLIGTVRVTTGTSENHEHLSDRIGRSDIELNEYAPNIQIADLNCLNAVLAVIKWKKIVGFYQDLKQEHNTLYFVNTGKLLNDDLAA